MRAAGEQQYGSGIVMLLRIRLLWATTALDGPTRSSRSSPSDSTRDHTLTVCVRRGSDRPLPYNPSGGKPVR